MPPELHHRLVTYYHVQPVAAVPSATYSHIWPTIASLQQATARHSQPAAGHNQPQLAAASHSRPKLAAAGRSSPGCSTASLAFPAFFKVDPFELCRCHPRCRHSSRFTFHFILVIYACSYAICLYLCLCHAFVPVSLLCNGVYHLCYGLHLKCYGSVLLHVMFFVSDPCVFALLSVDRALSRSRDCTSFERFGHGFV